jgi:hypothetical protein
VFGARRSVFGVLCSGCREEIERQDTWLPLGLFTGKIVNLKLGGSVIGVAMNFSLASVHFDLTQRRRVA